MINVFVALYAFAKNSLLASAQCIAQSSRMTSTSESIDVGSLSGAD